MQSIIDNQHIYENSANPHRKIKEFRSDAGDFGNIKYLLLAADLESGAGQLIMQPWFARCNHLLQADLCAEWSEPINFVIENDGISEREALAATAKDEHKGNVVHFPTNNLDTEISEAGSGY